MKAADQDGTLLGARNDEGRGKPYDLASIGEAYLPTDTDTKLDRTR